MKRLVVISRLRLVTSLAPQAFAYRGSGAVYRGGGAAMRGPAGGAAVRGPYGGAAVRGPTAASRFALRQPSTVALIALQLRRGLPWVWLSVLQRRHQRTTHRPTTRHRAGLPIPRIARNTFPHAPDLSDRSGGNEEPDYDRA